MAPFRLLRGRPWDASFTADVERLLDIQISDRDELASLLLPEQLFDWVAVDPDHRLWAMRVDIVDKRFHWSFAFYENAEQQIFGRRWLEPASRQAYHDLIWRRSKNDFVENLAEHLFAAILPLYDRLEIRRIDLMASLASGGILWPAFGAVPKDARSWQSLANDLRRRLRREPEYVRAAVSDDITALLVTGPHAVLDILQYEGPRTDPLGKRLLKRTRYKVAPEDGASWQAFAEAILQELKKEPKAIQVTATAEIEQLLAQGPSAFPDIAEYRPPGRLGKRLLKGTRYAAAIELGDPITRQILEKRIERAYGS